MENENVKVLNVTPVNTAKSDLQQCVQDTVHVMNETLKDFEEMETEQEKKAKSFLTDISKYMQSKEFKDDVNEASKKYNVPPKKIAQGFIEKAFGTVGDILGITISVVCNAGHTVIHIASTIAHSIINLLQGIANGIANIVTFNKTCVA